LSVRCLSYLKWSQGYSCSGRWAKSRETGFSVTASLGQTHIPKSRFIGTRPYVSMKMEPLERLANDYDYDGLGDLGVELGMCRAGDGRTSNVKRSAGILLPGWSSA
jgi:hypothetical protein